MPAQDHRPDVTVDCLLMAFDAGMTGNQAVAALNRVDRAVGLEADGRVASDFDRRVAARTAELRPAWAGALDAVLRQCYPDAFAIVDELVATGMDPFDAADAMAVELERRACTRIAAMSEAFAPGGRLTIEPR